MGAARFSKTSGSFFRATQDLTSRRTVLLVVNAVTTASLSELFMFEAMHFVIL